jgi:hypothetical protein
MRPLRSTRLGFLGVVPVCVACARFFLSFFLRVVLRVRRADNGGCAVQVCVLVVVLMVSVSLSFVVVVAVISKRSARAGRGNLWR